MDFLDEKTGKILCARCQRKEALAVNFDGSSGRFLCDPCYTEAKLEQGHSQEGKLTGKPARPSLNHSMLPLQGGKGE